MNEYEGGNWSFDIDKVPGVVLTREEHDLFEYGDGNLKGLNHVIPKKSEMGVTSPTVLLNKLEKFYDEHPHPKAKGMAKLVRGFKAKFLR